VRAITSQLPFPDGHGDAPSTHPVWSLVNVADRGRKPLGTLVPAGPTGRALAEAVAVGEASSLGGAVTVTVGDAEAGAVG
jgi:hypothetical protein